MNQECTTRNAAKILGISVTSVQKLVESGTLAGWKTKGGHRRILLSAVDAYKLSRSTLESSLASGSGPSSSTILVLANNVERREFYSHLIESWDFSAALVFCKTGYDALIQIALHKPDIFLADMTIAGVENFQLLKAILTYPDLSNMHMAVLREISQESNNNDIDLPEEVVFLRNNDELRGYLSACCAKQIRLKKVANNE
ncbi:helix-turn-helix domain-containing protein [Actimicrobium sp. CCI2.3]|uniref:helix-turn-helix domain-containing protein n=1 Tax=Actimicrobium sp. CCI2.3 TaxID=3048616 RepID=UPI002AB5D99F|nr:helix-turn-helix domain-containing protein [Actimicrobium sp. CCI2.3]MDY7575105.1 excisionase family DNA-binding protein [Actimicrobium sp. CCI2.3]MEB0022554.1 excisionase family DNA-binding protein [Actimicrobium sp. CCI2.3]